MKKLLLVLFTVISVSAFSQGRYTIYRVCVSQYSEMSEEFNTEHEGESNMTLNFDGWIISISDKANSRYITSNYDVVESNSDETMISYDAIDEKNRNCKILLYRSKMLNISALSVVYSDYMYTYYYY